MGPVRSTLETIHLAALGVWAGALVGVGAMAAITFPRMRSLDPHLGSFAAYEGEHWRVAAGSVMDQVFRFADWLGVGAACVALATLAVVMSMPGASFRRAATVLRSIALVAVAGITALTMLSLRPEMDRELQAFWDAARLGDSEAAEAHRQAFDRLHPRASMLLVTQLVFVVWAFVAGAFDALRAPAGGRGGQPS